MDEIILSEPENGDWLIGVVPVITNLWKDKVVYALVTAPKRGKDEIIQDQHITVDTLYEKIKSRELQLNTKGYFPNKVIKVVAKYLSRRYPPPKF